MILYTDEHEWVEIEGFGGTAGITKFAARQLGDITYVDFPSVGDYFAEGEMICEIESVKSVSEFYAPISGKITEVNRELEDIPELVNESPEEDGWIVKIKADNPEEAGGLMNEEEYREYLSSIE